MAPETEKKKKDVPKKENKPKAIKKTLELLKKSKVTSLKNEGSDIPLKEEKPATESKDKNKQRLLICGLLVLLAVGALVFALNLPTRNKSKDAYKWPDDPLLEKIPKADNAIAGYSRAEDDDGSIKIQIDIGSFTYRQLRSYTKKLERAGYKDSYAAMLLPPSRRDLIGNTTVYYAESHGNFSLSKMFYYPTKEELDAASKGTWVLIHWYDSDYTDSNGDSLDYTLRIYVANYELIESR